ncbi:ABC transporter substrate-binding protein [Enterovibrio norvegicus]|uniref:ABC transporter substrate-binding protein n=1 Tax=Enterovibrio norvegicus TaxID=188144 RepID=UPI0013D5BD19|nr:ABC transporter substrate-binding protein [Enterovibrio norvegicus]
MTDISYADVAKKKKTVRLFVYGAIIIAAIAAWFSMQTPSTVTPEKSNTLSISGPWEISSLDPSKQGYILTRMQVIETLLNVNEKGEITPGLASAWQVSDDGVDWTFTLKDDVVFHDGTAMNVDAVLGSLNNALKKHGTLKKASVESIKAVGDNQIQFHLSEPYVAFPALLTNYSTAIVAPASYSETGDVATLYGTGPYQMESFEPPHKLTVKKFGDYWGDKANITFATYLTGHRPESRILQAKSGEADIVFTLAPAMITQLADTSDVNVHSNLIPRTLFVKLNSGHPFLDDVRARKALSMAINRAAIAKNVLSAEGSETAQLLPSSMSQWYVADLPNDEFNHAEAKALLAEMGWEANESGKLTRGGKPFQIRLITYADRPELATVATAIQAQWAELGVDLIVDITNSSMIPAGHADGSLEMALIARNFGFIADPLPIISTDFSNGGGDWGTMNWENAEVDAAIAELMQTRDTARSTVLSQHVAKAIHEDYPVLPISSYSQHTAVNSRVQGFAFDPFERNYFINQMDFK